MASAPVSIFWFRRDLRIDDNPGLLHTLKSGQPVVPIFIYDKDILSELRREDARVSFIHAAIFDLNTELKKFGAKLFVYHGKPLEIFKQLLAQHNIFKVFTNEDYEPYAIQRDEKIRQLLKAKGIAFELFKDHVLFAKKDIVKDNGEPYKVFGPYARRWLARFEAHRLPTFSSMVALENHTPVQMSALPLPTLAEIGFRPTSLPMPEVRIHSSVLKRYAQERDFPARQATTKIGVHLRFGTISIRQAIRSAEKHSAIWLKELIWREFFQMILFHYPQTVSEPFDPRFKKFPWRKSLKDFELWKNGQTGYPIVDAGMRELKATGFIHNRVRMIVGSFLTKHLLLDWRWGERHFADTLFDFDLASNVGNWQWVAGCGVDAAPYFRIFNPELQTKKFDSQLDYIRQWVPELESSSYPEPMVCHEMARRRALVAFEKIKKPTTEQR